MRLVLDNFQAIEHADIEFPVGITVLRGRNGAGKSTCFRAINGLLLNPSGTSGYVQHGASEAHVTLENNGQSVTWVRTKSSCGYINNKTEEVFTKASKMDSTDVADLGFYIDKRGRVVNIHDMWSVLFPFGESDADMFKLFEDVFNIACSSDVIECLKKKEQEAKKHLTDLNNCLDDNKNQLERLSNRLNRLDADFVKTLGVEISELEQFCEEIEKDLEIYNRSKMLSLRAAPTTLNIDELLYLYSLCDELEGCLARYQDSQKYLTLIVPELDNALFSFDDIDIPYQKYCGLQREMEDIELQLTQFERDKKRIVDEMSKIKVCPTCGREME